MSKQILLQSKLGKSISKPSAFEIRFSFLYSCSWLCLLPEFLSHILESNAFQEETEIQTIFAAWPELAPHRWRPQKGQQAVKASVNFISEPQPTKFAISSTEHLTERRQLHLIVSLLKQGTYKL